MIKLFDLETLKERLKAFNYTAKVEDDSALAFCLGKVKDYILNDINHRELPEGLYRIAIDMAVGEFLLNKKTFVPSDLEGLSFELPAKEISEGDTRVSFDTSGNPSTEQKLTALIQYLLSYGKSQLACFRRFRW
ncbi:MAG: hypothetical protein E7A47_01185 [Clostridiales bacterium]|nr:hypothetical protein [Clostridiales bacterium]